MIKCPECFSMRSKVTNSRGRGDAKWRRRVCLECGESYPTYESYDAAILSIKLDKALAKIDRYKIAMRAFSELMEAEE